MKNIQGKFYYWLLVLFLLFFQINVSADSKNLELYQQHFLGAGKGSDWGLKLTFEQLQEGFPLKGMFEFRNLKCGGDFQTTSINKNESRIVLSENMKYGNCVRGCAIVLTNDLKNYFESCNSQNTGGGKFKQTADRENLFSLFQASSEFEVAPNFASEPTLSEVLATGTKERQLDGEFDRYKKTEAVASNKTVNSEQQSNSTSQQTANNNSNIWVDSSTGLMWGADSSNFITTWWAGMNNAKNSRLGGFDDWRLPTVDELSFIYMKTKTEKWIDNFTTLRANDHVVWSSEKQTAVMFYNGQIYPLPKYAHGQDMVIFVRGGDLSLLSNFNKTIIDVKEEINARVLKKEKEAQEQRIAEEKYEREQAADRKKFQAVLSNKNPQSMYLAAGAYARNGDRSRASEIYEKIISRFPKNNWAVKASDQLSDFRRADENRRNSQSSQNQQKSSNGGYRITQTYMNKDPMEVHGECYDGTTLTGHRYYSDEHWTIIGKTSVQNKYYSLEQSLSAACP